MPLIQPFRALRPVAAHCNDVVAPPYDVVDRAEAKALVRALAHGADEQAIDLSIDALVRRWQGRPATDWGLDADQAALRRSQLPAAERTAADAIHDIGDLVAA